MEDYVKGEVKEVEDEDGSLQSTEGVVHMRINGGTKIRNVLSFAVKRLNEPTVRKITWNGRGQVVTKVISCAEMMKRKVKGLHQVTTIKFKRIEEYWDPVKEGLERLKVNRDIPSISILLSKDPLDSTLLGYQAPDSCNVLERRRTTSDEPRPDRAAAPRTSNQSNKQRWNRQRNNTARTSASGPSAAAANLPPPANKRKRDAT